MKELALQHGLTVYQPTTLRDDEVQRLIADLHPELIVVVAYGKLLQKQFWIFRQEAVLTYMALYCPNTVVRHPFSGLC